MERHNLGFEVLTDVRFMLARRFGIVYELTPELDSVFQQWGIDLRGLHGLEEAKLPLPATFVIDSDKIIRYAFVDVDYTKRAEPDDILEVLESLK